MSGPVIATRALSKRYRNGTTAVSGLDLTVPAGSIFGFLGPNGSGKTTTIRMLLGLIAPTGGSSELLGAPAPAVLHRVGALIDGPGLYPHLTGRQNLARFDTADQRADAATRARRVEAALDRVGLLKAADRRARGYSTGMRQRLALARVLLRPRDLYLLDEPVNGLDPQGTREVRSLIRELAAAGGTVFLSSHLLSEVEALCTDAAVLAAGRLAAQGTVAELLAALPGRLHLETPDQIAAARVLTALGVQDLLWDGPTVSADLNGRSPDRVCAALVNAEVRVFGLTVSRPTLEDAFLRLTGAGFDAARH